MKIPGELTVIIILQFDDKKEKYFTPMFQLTSKLKKKARKECFVELLYCKILPIANV